MKGKLVLVLVDHIRKIIVLPIVWVPILYIIVNNSDNAGGDLNLFPHTTDFESFCSSQYFF